MKQKSLTLHWRKTDITYSRKPSLLSWVAEKHLSTGNPKGLTRPLSQDWLQRPPLSWSVSSGRGTGVTSPCSAPGSLPATLDTQFVSQAKLCQPVTDRRPLWKKVTRRRKVRTQEQLRN